MADALKLNRTKTCTCCKGTNERRRRQTGPSASKDVFFICPVCDTGDTPKVER